MANTVMLNTRIDKSLKDRGVAVLEAHGVSTTDFIRRSFEYLEEHQELPDFLNAGDSDKYTSRRAMLRSLGSSSRSLSKRNRSPQSQSTYDPLEDKHLRAEEKYKELLV